MLRIYQRSRKSNGVPELGQVSLLRGRFQNNKGKLNGSFTSARSGNLN